MNKMSPEYTISYSARAKQNLENIALGIYEFTLNLTTADTVINRIRNGIEKLKNLPERGSLGIIEGTREIYLGGYRVVYRINGVVVRIITVIHCSRLYP
ncbi:type II toxin-antitoxin system RelE/ParE family toxin [Testudinibacter sp. TR-2022]|uniref:type II toxin-antitoxin system RelE/ParE family toxin n=1 Tax=Testudinibacter sp. TR-2022 TaxID=2585029 RepID=UPI0011196EED|nr:type II toxin-antitoxin system RelE/ParE family toxin [Testudinibacter sp. TR-2022]TNH08505.1 type II toxin-antitoxin system RelE/ParE family toxin [Pasteurellaceae bacterium Phil11]TNH21917.1 type II toxin-antitoxin system RelE/ParE family toxin [Testudinibacter sp. TR-2022]TNH24538.1 type II toxin-antitoxin system RelE/ParE family toxin [Testudinibacter sp. TR-2022]